MSDRLVTCVRCGATIQHNTPLEHGGTNLPVPGLCDGCKASDHVLEIVSLGEYPAALCSCQKWGWSGTSRHGDTEDMKRQHVMEAHKQHVEESE